MLTLTFQHRFRNILLFFSFCFDYLQGADRRICFSVYYQVPVWQVSTVTGKYRVLWLLFFYARYTCFQNLMSFDIQMYVHRPTPSHLPSAVHGPANRFGGRLALEACKAGAVTKKSFHLTRPMNSFIFYFLGVQSPLAKEKKRLAPPPSSWIKLGVQQLPPPRKVRRCLSTISYRCKHSDILV